MHVTPLSYVGNCVEWGVIFYGKISKIKKL